MTSCPLCSGSVGEYSSHDSYASDQGAPQEAGALAQAGAQVRAQQGVAEENKEQASADYSGEMLVSGTPLFTSGVARYPTRRQHVIMTSS